MMKPETRLEWSFIGVATIQAIAILALQGAILTEYLDWINPVVYQVPTSYVIPVTFAVSTIGFLFQVLLAIDSCLFKNKIQIWMQCLINICLSVASGMQYFQTKSAAESVSTGYDQFKNPFVNTDKLYWKMTGPMAIACIVVAIVGNICICVLAFFLQMEFAWSVYEHISADTKMRGRHRKFSAYLVFLKVSVLLIILFVIVYGFINVHYVQPEFGLTMAIMPIAIIHAILASICVKREYLPGMIVVITFHIGAVVYLVTRLLDLYGTGLKSRAVMKEEMALFACFSLAFISASIVAAVICIFNFGQGLIPLLLGRSSNTASPSTIDFTNHQHLGITSDASERSSKRFEMD
ncbi:uncharacterized protein B0J16DRAFT_343432 [Fusarium flagelliforme]|uniref:uncharacterized protein n=1 Tax=Fusarium flagelliforme TaxID=2675880 RepID=UPI001E8D9E47|nr:uncharacterized protein B0J16DRAFT_343432 [Fusarium flagelliforme]KAH7186283.1 hypothetical protein B0J16DRAFT_343432 [Fusarium flagelliforme]